LRCSTSLSVADVGGSLETARHARQIPLDGPGKAWTVAIDRDGPGGTTLPSSTWTPSTSVSWSISTRMTGCTAPRLPSQGDGGRAPYISISARVSRPLNACLKWRAARATEVRPRPAPDAADRWLPERLRLTPHQEPTCSLGTRRDTSRRCGGLAPVPSASVLLHADARQEPEHLTTAGDSEGALLVAK
jgi:hypothetical protein